MKKQAVKLAPAYTEGQITQQIHLVNFHKAMIDMELSRIEERRKELAHAQARLLEMQGMRIVPEEFVI